MAYFVYILESERDGSYYVGHTGDLDKRLRRHNEGRSRYTRARVPWRLVYVETLDSKGEAMRREMEIKRRKDRRYISELVRAFEVVSAGEVVPA